MARWRYMLDDGAGAADGLALDEAMAASHGRDAASADPALRLYTYRNHVALCGRFQHLDAEIDVEACNSSGTPFNRRPTGGGAIVMGAGQLGVAVTMPAPVEKRPKAVLVELSQGVVAGLAKLGIEATMEGKNDLKVAGRKIAGLGLFVDGNGGMLFHASVLADLDVEFMLRVLDIPASKLGDAAAAAVSRRVTTVTEETGRSWSGSELREVIALGFSDAMGSQLIESLPTAAEADRRDLLVKSKYTSEDWIFQRSPKADVNGTAVLKTPGGLVRVYLALHDDVIKSALFTGDFNELPSSLADFEGSLKWARLSSESVATLAGKAFAGGTGLGVSAAEVVDAVMQAGERAVKRGAVIAAPDRTGSCYFPEGGARNDR